jgi:hypothetical protein
MIWRLFKPRQIVKVSIPDNITLEEHKLVLDDLNKKMGKEYIVMLVVSSELTKIQIEIIK